MVDILIGALRQLVLQLAHFLPQIIMALAIWWIGKYLLGISIRLLSKINIRGTKLDNQAIELLVKVVMPLGKFLLALIILDYLGIGRTVIGSIVNGLTLGVAIAVGFAFGKALEQDANRVVNRIRNYVNK